MSRPSRRSFLALGSAAAASSLLAAQGISSSPVSSGTPIPPQVLANPAWLKTWHAALAVLAGNVRTAPGYAHPVLFEGSTYQGIWQECGPQEALVYASLSRYIPPREDRVTPLDIARNSHMAFFSLQREDGQLPASVKMDSNGFGQIQMVVPIAATAWEVAQMLKDEAFLAAAYQSCSRWDAWLRRYRDTRKTGLVEGFCTYDTGHDNSPRWKGIPNRCPDADARKAPPLASMPRLCPDLSATVYGARVALAAMAQALGKSTEAERWKQEAATIRRLILDKLYSVEDSSFYDLDAQQQFVRVRSDVNSRVLGEHVLELSNPAERQLFTSLWNKQLHNPKAFWGKYPLTSVAMDDPQFVRPIPRNSWGGASQALTALRAPRWMAHYQQQEALQLMMQRWCEAILRDGKFCQQMDPWTGEFTQPDPGGYSPAALVFLDFSVRLAQSPAKA